MENINKHIIKTRIWKSVFGFVLFVFVIPNLFFAMIFGLTKLYLISLLLSLLVLTMVLYLRAYIIYVFEGSVCKKYIVRGVRKSFEKKHVQFSFGDQYSYVLIPNVWIHSKGKFIAQIEFAELKKLEQFVHQTKTIGYRWDNPGSNSQVFDKIKSILRQ